MVTSGHRTRMFMLVLTLAFSAASLSAAEPTGILATGPLLFRGSDQERMASGTWSSYPVLGRKVSISVPWDLGRMGRSALQTYFEWKEQAIASGQRRLLVADPLGYLDRTLARLGDRTIVPTPLLQAFATQGSPVRSEYLRFATTLSAPPAEVRKAQRAFTAGLIRFLRTASYTGEQAREQDLWLFSELSGAVSAAPSMEIGRSFREPGRSGGFAPGRVFRAPRSLTVPGHRGQLGALLDLLEGTEVQVRSEIAGQFDRRTIRRTIGSSI